MSDSLDLGELEALAGGATERPRRSSKQGKHALSWYEVYDGPQAASARSVQWGVDPTDSPICSVPGCDDPARSRGWCNKHYLRWQRLGTTELPTPPAPFDRFVAKVEWSDQRHEGTRCLVWTGSMCHGGYGQFRSDDRHWVAHRWLYEHWFGPIPEGLQIDHLCRNRACVNPAHLEPVTQQENINRGDRGRDKTRKTHCIRGHEFTAENTKGSSNGNRVCIACDRERRSRYHANNRERLAEYRRAWRRGLTVEEYRRENPS